MVRKVKNAKNRIIRRLKSQKWSASDFEAFIDEIVRKSQHKKPTKAELRKREILALYGLMDVIECRINNLTAELLNTGDGKWH